MDSLLLVRKKNQTINPVGFYVKAEHSEILTYGKNFKKNDTVAPSEKR